MKNKQEFTPDPNAAILGTIAAFQAAVRALVFEHPNPTQLAERLHTEKESSLAFLMNSPCPEAAIDVFESTMQSLIPYVEHVDPRGAAPAD